VGRRDGRIKQRRCEEDEMAILYFPAIIETGPGPGYGVFFPELPGWVFLRGARSALGHPCASIGGDRDERKFE
jgi:hypothetical protein